MDNPQHAAARVAFEKKRLQALEKCAELAGHQIAAARGVLQAQQIPVTPENLLRVAKIVAMNWADLD